MKFPHKHKPEILAINNNRKTGQTTTVLTCPCGKTTAHTCKTETKETKNG